MGTGSSIPIDYPFCHKHKQQFVPVMHNYVEWLVIWLIL